jgi:hypothetical protein
MIVTVIAVLVVLWLLGWLVLNLGAFIHILLVVALIVLVWHLITGNRARV